MSRPSSCPDARRQAWRLGVLAAWLLCAATARPHAQAPVPLPLLEPAPAADAAIAADRRPDRPASPRARRTRRARLRLDRLRQALDDVERRRPGAASPRAFVLNLFDDVAWTAVADRTESDRFGHRTWAGHVEGKPLSTVSLTMSAGAVVGTVQVDDRIYRLEGDASVVRVDDLDPASFGVELAPRVADRAAGDTLPQPGEASPVATADGVPVAEVLLLYTSEARDARGGTAGIRAALAQGIADANTALARSGVAGALRAVAMEEVAYAQSDSSLAQDLSLLASTPAVAAMRDAAGADLVALVVARTVGNACGIAYLGPTPSYAYSVTAVPCLAQYTLAHEIAHNFGSDHAPGDSPPVGWRSYSYGYKDPALPSPFRTVMAYACPSGASCPRVLHFSTPRVVEATSGRLTGTGTQDNAASLGEAFPLVEAFRATTTPLTAPTGIAAGVSGQSATLAWQPVAGATGYVVEAGTAPGAADLFAGQVGPVTAVGAPLPPGTYYARVRATRGTELGPSSSDVAFGVAPPVPPSAPGPVTATVSGSTVTLVWAPATGDVSGGYRLEAGYAPGASNAAVALVPGTGVVVGGVPPGTYYVRVRALGAAGSGAAAPDATVVVP